MQYYDIKYPMFKRIYLLHSTQVTKKIAQKLFINATKDDFFFRVWTGEMNSETEMFVLDKKKIKNCT